MLSTDAQYKMIIDKAIDDIYEDMCCVVTSEGIDPSRANNYRLAGGDIVYTLYIDDVWFEVWGARDAYDVSNYDYPDLIRNINNRGRYVELDVLWVYCEYQQDLSLLFRNWTHVRRAFEEVIYGSDN